MGLTHVWTSEKKGEVMVEHYPGTTPGQGSTYGGSGQQVSEQARQQSQQLAYQARQQASDLANRGTQQLKGQLANQKHNVSQRMVPFQSALRETAQQLRRQGQGSAGDYANRAADQLERFSVYLRETEVEEIMEEVRGIARRRPGLFLGGGAAIGFFATRFLKSTSEQRSTSSARDVYGAAPTATSTATITHGAQEPPATALPPVGVEVEPPTAGRSPADRDRTEPPLGS